MEQGSADLNKTGTIKLNQIERSNRRDVANLSAGGGVWAHTNTGQRSRKLMVLAGTHGQFTLSPNEAISLSSVPQRKPWFDTTRGT